ncbi:Beta-barrel assembly-enhancing protease [Pseudidiomarina piscicola]|uniref:Beta-barrel assembly-enhancing protease n=1 Tax=Pseudidiomarina piscicola TaxID=2614830 RepID=A0A6S6WQI1_9GAMM|nr:tetratricopeptide repeat protein [Pseudidiomarina piscicola]CAB0151268.1 Beta-barrel assembly-enhancing protease [Pseudidiomarina piscicola]VZT40773.1 Beta-barrel assembly-enhancing protease [Pseudomonas aeruginosa]
MSDLQKLFQQALQAFRAGQFSQAEKHCRSLLRYDAKHADVLHLLALCLTPQGQVKAAAGYLETALKHHPSHYAARKALIDLYIDHQKYDRAEQHCKRLLEQQPQQAEPYFLEAKLYRALGFSEKALLALQNGRRYLQQPSAVMDYLMACLFYDLENYPQTEAILQNLVQQLPEYIDAHIALNKLYWEIGPQDKFLTSIKDALERLPDSQALHYSLAAHQLMAGDAKAALETCQRALQKFPQAAEFAHLSGSAYCRQEHFDDALKAYSLAVKWQPDALRHRIDYATSLMRNGDYEQALPHLQAVEKQQPNSQEMLAYKALCLHALGDPEAQQLNNYEALVQPIALEPPTGYDSREAFMAELAQTLQDLHKTQQQPLDQSVRNGTQTVGHLLAQQAPIITEFKAMLETAAAQYLAKLNDLGVGQDHPLLRRQTADIRFTGAWSVRLTESGFHSNHVHPEGWISCCTYIQLPEQVTPDDKERAGWIKFGDPGMALPSVEVPKHAVCPQVGYCVFFPSYFFHGTVPFHGEGVRMTAPCDISPAW